MVYTKKLLTLSSGILGTITLSFCNLINSNIDFDYQFRTLEMVNNGNTIQSDFPEAVATLAVNTNKELDQRALGLGIISLITIVGEISAFSLRRNTEHRKSTSVNDLMSTTEWIRGKKANMDQANLLLALKSDKLASEINETAFEIDSNLENELESLPNYFTTICHEDTVTDIQISPNGDYLATRSYRTVKLVQVNTEQEIAVIFHSNGIREIEFSSNGDYLVTRSFDGKQKLIKVSTAEEINTNS